MQLSWQCRERSNRPSRVAATTEGMAMVDQPIGRAADTAGQLAARQLKEQLDSSRVDRVRKEG